MNQNLMNPYAMTGDMTNLSGGLITATILFAIGLLAVRITRHRENMGEQTRLFVVSYVLRLFMVIVIYRMGFASFFRDDDASGWIAGLYIYEKWLNQGYSLFSFPVAFFQEIHDYRKLSNPHFLYHIILSAEFMLFGTPGRVTAAALNVLVGSWIPVLAYRFSYQIFHDLKAARYLGWSLALMPSLIVFSAQTIKEPIVVFLEVLSLYCCVQISQLKFRVRHILAFISSYYFMQYLRFYIGYVMIGTIFLAFAIPPIFRSKNRNFFIFVGLSLSPMIGLITYRSAISEIKANKQLYSMTDMGFFRGYSQGFGASTNLEKNSNVMNPYDITKPAQFLPGLIFGVVHLLYAPFPWHWLRGSRLMLSTAPEVVWWYYNGTFRLVRGIRNAVRINMMDMLIPMLFCLPMIFYYGLIFNNIGLAYRYKAQIYPELMLFSAIGYKQRKVVRGYDSYQLDNPEIAPNIRMPQFQPGFGQVPGRYQPGYFMSNPAFSNGMFRPDDRF